MTKISGNEDFGDYVGQYITMNDNGTLKKYLVKNVNKDSIVRNVSYLVPGQYEILGESDNQRCDMCENACINNIPIFKLHFANIGYLNSHYLNNDYSNDRYALYLNSHYLGTINTSAYRTDNNQIWFIPNNCLVSSVDTDYINYTSLWNIPTAGGFGLSAFDPSFLNVGDWNNLEIRAVTAINPNMGLINGQNVDDFYIFPEIVLDIHKIFETTNTNINVLSCQRWQMHDFRQAYTDIGGGISQHFLPGFTAQSLSAGTFYQQFSATFLYLNPCVKTDVEGYTLDTDHYYRFQSTEGNIYIPQMAYGYYLDPNVYGSNTEEYYYLYNDEYPVPSAPTLRRYEFYTDTSLSATAPLFCGKNKKSPTTRTSNPYAFGGGISTCSPWGLVTYNIPPYSLLYSDYGQTLFEGTFYIKRDTSCFSGPIQTQAILATAIDTGTLDINNNKIYEYILSGGMIS